MMDLQEWLTFGNTIRTHPGAEGPPRELPSLPPFHIEISLREMRESFVEAPPCHILRSIRQLHVKASAKRVQDLDEGDIFGGGGLHVDAQSFCDILGTRRTYHRLPLHVDLSGQIDH